MENKNENLELSVARWMNSRQWWAVVLAALFGASLLTISCYRLLVHLPAYDELLHVLSARGVVATGEPVIAQGVYSRAELFTRLVALSYGFFGDNLVSARIPAFLSAVILVALIGAWVARRMGLLPGLAAATFLCLVPTTSDLAVMVRFYTLHAVAVATMLIAVFEALQPTRSIRSIFALALLALVAAVLAVHLQISTVVAVGAGLVAGGVLFAMDHWQALRTFLGARLRVVSIALAIAAAVACFGVWKLGFFDLMNMAPLWAQRTSGKISFYLIELTRSLPFLWPLLPLAALLTILKYKRMGIFCTVLVISALIVHSISASKSPRYVYYLFPFMSVLWSGGATGLLYMVAGGLKRNAIKSEAIALLAGVLLVGFAVVTSLEGQRVIRMSLGVMPWTEAVSAYANEGDWQEAAKALRPLASHADRVVVSSGVKALYALGDYDYELNASVVLETETGEEFGRDLRTGRLVIGEKESLAQVIDQGGQTLVIADGKKLNTTAGIPPDSVTLLDSHCKPVDAGTTSGVRAWLCGEAGQH